MITYAELGHLPILYQTVVASHTIQYHRERFKIALYQKGPRCGNLASFPLSSLLDSWHSSQRYPNHTSGNIQKDSILVLGSCGVGMTLAAYMHVGALSVMLWDILTNIKQDYSLLFSYEFCQHVALYSAARYATFVYAAMKTAFLTVPMPDCENLDAAISAFYMLAIFTTLLQASLRLWKLLGSKGNMLALFGLLWFVTVGGNITLAIGVVGHKPMSKAPNMSACVDHIESNYVSVAFIALAVYHACMMVAVVLAIRQNVLVDRERLTVLERYERMVRGASYLFLVQPLTLTDRVFYVAAAALSLTSLLWFFASSLSNDDASLRLAFLVVYLVGTNLLVGRVFRNSVLAPETRHEASSLPTISPPRSLKYNRSAQKIETSHRKNLCVDPPQIDRVVQLGFGTGDAITPSTPILKVEVQRVTEYARDYATESESEHSGGTCQSGHMYV